MLLSPEIKLVAARPPSERAEGPCGSPEWPGEAGLPGSQNRANAHQGSPGTGETCYSPTPSLGQWGAEPEMPQVPGSVGVRRERTIRRSVGIAGRAQELDEMEKQESEGLIVPMKPAHAPRAEPVEGRSAP